MMLGSIMSLGLGLFTITIGGVNCFREALGSLPLGAGSGERSPPPPPPCIACFFTGIFGSNGARSEGNTSATVFLTSSWPGLVGDKTRIPTVIAT